MCMGTTYRTDASGTVSGGPASNDFMPNDADCRWVITPSGGGDGQVVELVFSEFQLDEVGASGVEEVMWGGSERGPTLF